MKLLSILLNNNLDLGITVSIVGFGIVIMALALLSFLFTKMPAIINMKFSFKKRGNEDSSQIQKSSEQLEGNVTAAIGTALHLYFNDLHDEESNILTIRQIRKTYSPWSSKIYSVTQNWPRR